MKSTTHKKLALSVVKVVIFIISVLIFTLSLLGIMFYTVQLVVVNTYSIFDVSRILICLLGIISFAFYVVKNTIFHWLNIIWFLPQIIKISQRTFYVVEKKYFDDHIYNVTILFSAGFNLGWKIAGNTYLVMTLNLFALAGLLICLYPQKRIGAIDNNSAQL